MKKIVRKMKRVAKKTYYSIWSPKISMRVLITGDKVQGVNFRRWTKKRAEELGVSGWVRNRNDDSLEAVFFGEKHTVTELTKIMKKGPKRANVQQVVLSDYERKNHDFRIRETKKTIKTARASTKKNSLPKVSISKNKNESILSQAKLHHNQLNSFLIEYEARMMGLESFRLSDKIVKIYSPNTGRSALFRRAAGPNVSRAAHLVVMNKFHTKKMWENNKIPNSPFICLSLEDYEEALSFAKKYSWDIVLKPTDGYGGRGVFTDIRNEKEFQEYWKLLKSKKGKRKQTNKNILVEKKFSGSDYRAFVVGGKVAGILHRVPAYITGDGKSTVLELIESKKQMRNKNPDLFSRPIVVDTVVEHNIAALGYNLDSVIPKGKNVVLRNNANISTGGEDIDVTDGVPEKIKRLIEKAVLSIPNLTTSAVDILAKDISDDNDLTDQNLVLNELESDGAMCMHHFPLHGQARNLAAMILFNYFSDEINNSAKSRIQNYKHDFDDNFELARNIVNSILEPDGRS